MDPKEIGIAKVFMDGRSQAVRIPLAFRLPGEKVRVRRVPEGLLLEPIGTELESWFSVCFPPDPVRVSPATYAGVETVSISA